MQGANVIVVGAGVLGAFHAYYAALRGWSTLLLERNALPSDASTRNFGIIAQSLVAPGTVEAAYTRATAAIYRSIQDRHDITVSATGSLYLASTELENTVLREFAQHAPPDYRCTYLDPVEAITRYPFIQESYCQGALLFPDDLTLDPRRMLRQLIPFIERIAGVTYRPHTTVVGVTSTDQGCVVRDARGQEYVADMVIVCSGVQVQTLFPEVFQSSGLRICKLQMMRTVPQPVHTLPHAILSGLSIKRYPAFSLCPSYAQLEAQPMEEALRARGIHLLIKQSDDGTVTIGDSHEYWDPDAAGPGEETTDWAINEAILAYGQRMVHLPTWRIQTMWNGYYLVHPEHDIYTHTIDGRIHIVVGAGKGMTLGPGFAEQFIQSLDI